MDTAVVLAALASALLHAGWNAAIKASPWAPRAMTAQMQAAAVLVLPILAWGGLPAPAAWPWMLASTVLCVAAVATMLRAYEHGPFGAVYPLMRASSVLLVLPVASTLARETPTPLGVAGVLLIAAAVGSLAFGSSGTPATRAWAHERAVWAWGVPAAVASVASYLLILWAWTHAPIAPAAALRDTSAVFAALLSVWVLKEPLARRVLVAVLLAAAGAVLIRLGWPRG